MIVDPMTHNATNKMIIDEHKIYTPYRIKTEKRQKTIVFSDHCAIQTTIEMKTGRNVAKQKGTKSKRWVLTDEGLNKFEEETTADMDLGDMSKDGNPYKEWTRKIDEIMHRCFVKRTVRYAECRQETISSKGKKIRSVLRKIAKRGKIQREVVKDYIARLVKIEAEKDTRRKVEKVKETVSQLTEDDVLSPNAFWKLRKSISKNKQLQLQIINKRDGGGTTTEVDEIKTEVKNEFIFRLRNREPAEGWEGYVEATNRVVEELLKNQDESSPAFTLEELKDGLRKMKTCTSPDFYNMYADVLRKAGTGALKTLLQVFNIIKTTCVIPEEWRKVLITMIYKNKGSHLDLEKYRGIFLTIIVSKLFERLLQARMKPSLDKVSLCQAGSRSGKSGSDDLFLLRSAVDHSMYMNNSIYITTYDFQQAFDSLWLQDCILVLKKLGVENDLLKLIYEMNKTAIVQVKTPHGLTEPAEVKDIVKQGGVLGSPLCSATTAEYCDKNAGISIGTATVATLAFVDDIADISGCTEDAITAHINALEFALRKKLNFAADKCFIMIVNRKGTDVVPDLYINGEKVDCVEVIKYLGDIFNSKGNNEDLMNDRVCRATASMVSIQGFMREISLGVHSLSVYLLLSYTTQYFFKVFYSILKHGQTLLIKT